MGVYQRCIFPFLLDRAMASKVLRGPRTRTLARARGRILEVGFGTGRNLPHYPPHVRRIEALDPDVDLDRYSRPRIAEAAVTVDFHHLDAACLPFDAASFDTVVCTMTLCSIPDVVRALAEIRRILKPGGEFLFLEHGLAPVPTVARWQRRLTPIQRRLGGGCHLDRDTVRLVTEAGLPPARVEHYYLRGVPRFAGYMSEGYAVRT